jgi:hypothetical protein
LEPLIQIHKKNTKLVYRLSKSLLLTLASTPLVLTKEEEEEEEEKQAQ